MVSSLFTSGQLADLTTFVTVDQGVILRVDLVKATAAEVRLFIQYTDTGSGETNEHTTSYYNTQPKVIAYFDESVPFQKFTVDVALMSGSLMGPLYHDPTKHGMCFVSRFYLPSTPTCQVNSAMLDTIHTYTAEEV